MPIEINHENRYLEAKKKKIGEMIICPECGTQHVKHSKDHVFCSNKGAKNCKDLYWNRVSPVKRRKY